MALRLKVHHHWFRQIKYCYCLEARFFNFYIEATKGGNNLSPAPRREASPLGERRAERISRQSESTRVSTSETQISTRIDGKPSLKKIETRFSSLYRLNLHVPK